jgi:hypothetical protein
VKFVVRLQGRGRIEVAAHGMADAEHLAETQLSRCWPAARLQVTQLRRAHEEPRIAEEFLVHYLLHASEVVEAPDAATARLTAFRQARERLEGTRFWEVGWTEARVEVGSGQG